MAKIFTGMSKDNFLNSLVELTGLNGHDLYSYLKNLVESDIQFITKIEEKEKQHTQYKDDCVTFTGTIEEIQKYYIGLGGKSTTASYFGCCVPELVCSHCASRLNVNSFIWYKPTKLIKANGITVDTIVPHGVYWENEQVGYLPLQFEDNG